MRTRREQVIAAIDFSGPDYVPIYFFNRDIDKSDVVQAGMGCQSESGDADLSEWGYRWERVDATMGQPKRPAITRWDELDNFKAPDPCREGRFNYLSETRERYRDRFVVAGLGISGFTVMSFIAGFANLLEGFYTEREKVERLADIVFGYEIELIRRAAGFGADAVGFADDWGSQNGLFISPGLWRSFFLPRYAEQFGLARSLGMRVMFHSCGDVLEIIPDFFDAGVDILNVSQPNLYDIAALGETFGGKRCFMCPVSYQTTSISGGPDEIRLDVASLIKHLGGKGGGLIGYVEEYASIGLSEENYRACARAFEELGGQKL